MVSLSSRTRGEEQGQRNIQLNATSKIWLGRSVPHHPPKINQSERPFDTTCKTIISEACHSTAIVMQRVLLDHRFHIRDNQRIQD